MSDVLTYTVVASGTSTMFPGSALGFGAERGPSPSQHGGAKASASSDRVSAVENAVFGYIQAVRALGRTRVTSGEISAALMLKETEVIAAFRALRDKGVKLAV